MNSPLPGLLALSLFSMVSSVHATGLKQTTTSRLTSQTANSVEQTDQIKSNKGSLTVLHTGDEKVSTLPYFEAINAIRDKGQTQIKVLQTAKQNLAAIKKPDTPVSLKGFFPLYTHLQVGQPSVLRVEKLTTPLFVIGMDATSLRWLEESADMLSQLHAIGIVVQADSYERFQALKIRARKHGIHLEIGFGDPLEVGYGLKSYPVLIQRADR